jgi:hypothetical protein
VGVLTGIGTAGGLGVRFCAALLVALLCGGLPAPGRAQTSAIEAEYQVKAAFLYKFLTFVEWPAGAFAGADDPIVIGVLGAEPMAEELSRVVASRTVGSRAVSVRRFGVGDPVSSLHVLFVGHAQGPRLPSIVAAAGGQALLTVSETEDGRAAAGMINFVVVDDKVRFDVVLHRAERAGLRISARLLSVARKVWATPS